MATYKSISLVQRPSDKKIGPHLFETKELDIPEVKDGQILIKQTHMSLDPAMLGWMSEDRESYIPPVELGEVMRSSGVGEVVKSKNAKFAEGDKVMGMTGWQEYVLSDGSGFNKLQSGVTEEMALCVFALPGLTATTGLYNFGQPKEGETIVVTGAAGSVGSMVGQLAKADGLRVIGVVGSDEKADWIVNELGFDGAINYKTDDIESKLAELTPDKIDVYFENTGGPIQHHVFNRMNAPTTRLTNLQQVQIGSRLSKSVLPFAVLLCPITGANYLNCLKSSHLTCSIEGKNTGKMIVKL